MANFDIAYLATTLVCPRETERSVKEHLICELIRTAVEVYNFPDTENTIVGNLLSVMECEYDVMGGEHLFKTIIDNITNHAKKCGWDKRLVVKAEFKTIGKGFYQARVMMDLDETFTVMYSQGIPKQDTDNITDIVSDNPNMDEINELTRVHHSETRRRVPVLSDRLATAVQSGTDTSWRSGDRWSET